MQCEIQAGAGAGKTAPTTEPERPGKGGKGKGKGGGAGGGGGGAAPRPAAPRRGAPALRAVVAGVVAGCALLVSGGVAAGQASPDILLSLSADDTLPGGPVRDQDLVLHATGHASQVSWPSETFALMAAETAAGLHPVFTDIDAIHELPFGVTAAQRMLFSIGTDEAGFKDGDIIGVGSNGAYAVVTAEAEFIAAAGCTDGNVDIDAYQLDDDGTVLFSFGDNEASSFLSGDTAGTVKDGDVLAWAAGAATAQILFTENQINALVTHAIGSTATTTDTTGLARDPATGAVLFCVQSPSNHDASVFSAAGGGSLLSGQAESDLGFTGAPELDALCVAVSHFPELTTSEAKPAPGSTVTLQLHDATPGFPHLALAALDFGPEQLPMAGWGGFVLTQDVMLMTSLAAAPSLLIVPDGTGSGSLSAALPLALGAVDVVVQVISPGPDLASTNPVLLELAQ